LTNAVVHLADRSETVILVINSITFEVTSLYNWIVNSIGFRDLISSVNSIDLELDSKIVNSTEVSNISEILI